MKLLELLPIGEIKAALLESLRPAIEETYRVRCRILPHPLDPECTLHQERRQFYSSEILHLMQERLNPQSWRLVGVAAVDLYIPILTFVFGEAQMGGPCALVSTYRLRQEFYGLPEDAALLGERLRKEAIHEIGHTLNLTHCDDYGCAMAPSHAVEWIDLKGIDLCPVCQSRVFPDRCASGYP